MTSELDSVVQSFQNSRSSNAKPKPKTPHKPQKHIFLPSTSQNARPQPSHKRTQSQSLSISHSNKHHPMSKTSIPTLSRPHEGSKALHIFLPLSRCPVALCEAYVGEEGKGYTCMESLLRVFKTAKNSSQGKSAMPEVYRPIHRMMNWERRQRMRERVERQPSNEG